MNKFEKVPEGVFNKVEHNKQEFINKFIDDLEGLFPETVKDGIVDFQALLDRFGEYEESNKIEKYNMTWVGKRQAIKEADKDIVGRTLKYVEEDSKNPETTENIYIEGDNLEVLKLLRQSYYGKIKMIYIDPPYNTGNDFVYKDDFTITEEEYAKYSGEVDEHGERLVKNSKDSGRYHSDWLNMMYPRLKVARDLLTDDGVIFISIDDNEVHNMRKICDEIFGQKNFVGNIIWERAFAPVNLKKHFSESHDYICVYAKNKEKTICNGLPRDMEADSRYSNPDNDPRGPWTSGDLSVGPAVEKNIYEIITPSGRKVLPPKGRSWRISKEKFEEEVKENRVWFGEDGNNVPRTKRFLSEVKSSITPMTIWKYTEVGHSQDASKKLKELFDGDYMFDYPKSVPLIKRCIELYSNKDSIILDFFSGSATTAHAVMDLNAEDGGNRKYIMVQLPEPTDEKSEAYKAGYKNICEIGKERIRRAGDKIKEELKEKYNSANEEERKSMKNPEDLDIGFKVFKVEDTNLKLVKDTVKEGISMEEHKAISPKDNKDFNPHFTDIDVVYEMMLKRQDIDLNEEIILLDDIGERTYLVGYTMLICLEEEVTEEMVEKIGSLDVDLSWIIMRDSAFGNNINLKLNTVNKLRTIVKENHRKEQKIYWI
ncbi:site-specific DNA-methyltransferase [Anaerosalibacter bizertensis]|uniref:site-specific DNA-methyltransferase n=1 Tax=Anaerosalibacter bizertensis TaxID=932217 RepID=UPI001C0F2FC7|nr:site-specific DNA-methyltransferase [Anaerosalibacter bizertensis]MBU5292641.1 site-specific DNA-methyltransferase [Anaerosalibacter bizertensis]